MTQLSQNQMDELFQIANSGQSGARVLYYDKLSSYGVNYGNLALGIIAEDTMSGRAANEYVLNYAEDKFITVSHDQMNSISNALMESDYAARVANSVTTSSGKFYNDLPYTDVRDYHIFVYDTLGGTVPSGQGLPPNAWTAYAPVEILGLSVWNSILNSTSFLTSAGLSGQMFAKLHELEEAHLENPQDSMIITQLNLMNDWFQAVAESTGYALNELGSPIHFKQHLSESQVILGSNGEDTIQDENTTYPHAKKIYMGLSGNDIFGALTDSDQFRFYDGGNGDDTFLVLGQGKAEFHGSHGTDILDFTSYEKPTSMIIASTSDTSGSGGLDIRFKGVESLIGSAYDDTFHFRTLAKSTDVRSINGGNGEDTIILAAGGSAHNIIDHEINLETGLLGQNTSITSIENVIGGSGYDRIIGNTGANVLTAMGNADYIDGRGGQDTLIGASYNDTLIGGDQGDDIKGMGGHDYIDAKGGNDIIMGGAYADDISGGDGNDLIYGGDLTNLSSDHGDVINGGRGVDEVYGGRGADLIYGDKPTDFQFPADIVANSEKDQIFGEAGNDTIYGGYGDDHIDGGADRDLLYGEDGDDDLFGGFGYDTLHGGIGDDLLDGGEGNDTLHGGEGNDLLIGGAGNNAFYGGSGDDVFVSGLGYDTIFDFEFGVDTLSRENFGTVVYEVRGIVDDMIIRAGSFWVKINDAGMEDRFEPWQSGTGFYGNNLAAYESQFDIIWA